MRRNRTYLLCLAVLLLLCGYAAAAFHRAESPVANAFDGGLEPAPGGAQSRWSGTYRVTAKAPRGTSTLTTTDTGTLELSVNGIQVTGTMKGHVETKMTGLFQTQGATDYTATLVGIVRKAADLPQIPKGLDASGQAAAVNEGHVMPARFLMSGVFGIAPNTHPYNAQQSSPTWALIILLGDGRVTDYDIPTIAMVPDTGHVTVTIHKQP